MLSLVNKKVLVVGGGNVAFRKISGILRRGAQVVVVSPQLNKSMQQLWRTENIQWVQKEFEVSDVDGAFLVFAATDCSKVNERVASSCSQEQLVNICNDGEASSFHTPAVYERSYLTVAVSTNGVSPGLAKRIRNEIAEQYDDLLDDYFEFLQTVRQIVKSGPFTAEEKRGYLSEVLDARFRESVEARDAFLKGIAVSFMGSE